MAQEVEIKIGAALTIWRGAQSLSGADEALILTIINTAAFLMIMITLLDRENRR